ncbi:hypothetical protein [Neorhodopirellula pilleata]|uniref:Uncharacterized protein n=1 Tax=Neorhodopirellula pilleata TaxID=2714738 RepID=A0A5C6ACU2_9BACT|nr:hypothetical protein [Neorhodopirellula pilleata]TWT97217.1 hypothetical protein Pla100_23670 [Neorhodopirellula pilleata]
MSISTKIVPAIALAALFTFVMGSEAKAQHGSHFGSHQSSHFGGHHGGSHSGFHSGGHHGSGHIIQPSRYVPTYPSYPSYPTYPSPNIHRGYHNTTHLDYHAPSLVPHNGHLDYRPGHYDVHQSGHWH